MLDPNFISNYSNDSLSKTYDKGMINIWDGKQLLESLIEKHGKTNLTKEEVKALTNVLTLIVWGEYAAWQTSSSLMCNLDDYGAKIAATSQAHDEARHYFTMIDYLNSVLNVKANELNIKSSAYIGLNFVSNANTIPKKLLGMQLMVEPVAISIFHVLKKFKEPILAELLEFYIKDEARHIALGVRYLPTEIKKMSYAQLGHLFIWQAKLLKYEIDGLFDLRKDLKVLGIDFIDLFESAEKRQVDAAKEMVEHLGWKLPIEKIILNVTRTYINIKKRLS